MMSIIRLSCVCAVAMISSGCQGPRPNARTFAYLRLGSTSQAEAFDATVQAMGERFRLAHVDPSAGVITTIPVESKELGTEGRVGDMVGVPRRVRRIATARVDSSDNHAEVWCKVVVEQYDSAEQQMFYADRSIDDMPTATAAYRDGATTAEQNAIWRAVRRDRQAERAVLQAVDELVQRKQMSEQ